MGDEKKKIIMFIRGEGEGCACRDLYKRGPTGNKRHE